MKTIIRRSIPVFAVLAALNLTVVAYASGASNESNASQTQVLMTVPVNLNTASVEQIVGKVKGLGKKKAEAIVAYRAAQGPFKSFEDLAPVKGLGESFVKKHLEALKHAFTLS